MTVTLPQPSPSHSPALSDFVSPTFSLLDMINPVIQKVSSDVPLRLIAEKTLQHIQTGFVDFTCPEHESWGRKFTTRIYILQ